jgi:hypothetical protein
MYRNINSVPDLVKSAELYVLSNDRMLYEPFFTIIEKYCCKEISGDSTCIIGGKIGIDLLLGTPLNKDSFMWEIYSNDTFNIGKAIVDDIYKTYSPHIDVSTVNILTDIKNIEQTVSINTRPILKIYSIGLKIDYNKILRPQTVKGYFGNNVQCLSQEIQLSDIYHNLYSLSKIFLWEHSYKTESILFNTISQDIIKIYTGGKRNIDNNNLRVNTTDKDFLYDYFSDRDVAIIRALPKCVFIGSVAMRLLHEYKSPITRLQILTDKSPDDILDALKTIINENLTYVEYKLALLTDFRLTKYTIYLVKSSTERLPILDIFNSLSYEIIPAVSVGDVLCATLWVLLRFKTIDAWSVKLLSEKTQGSGLNSVLTNIVNDIVFLRESIEKTSIDDLFISDPSKYIGTYITERVSKKKLVLDIGKRFAPYYPARISQSTG